MSPLSKEEMKEATKEAIKEWLDDQYRAFGKLSMFTILGAALCALLYFILRTNGWSVAATPFAK